jgi:hypothetical protein
MDISSQIKQDTTTTTTGDIQPLGHSTVEQTGFDSQNVAVLTKQPKTMPHSSSAPVTLSRDFINRPYPIFSGTAAIGSSLLTAAIGIDESNFIPPQSLLNITGVTGFRGTLCFSVVFSAPAQVAGVFKLAILPLNNGDIQSPGLAAFYASQLPQVEINLAEINNGTIKYPFTFDLDYLRVNPTDILNYCSAWLVPYIAPTGPSTIASVPFTIYQWVEDFETLSAGVATLTAIIPQMDKTEFQAVGPISTVMKYASKITSGIGAALPLISHYTRPLSWIMNGVGSIAAQFGWSKPNMATAKTVFAVAGRGYNNCLSVDTCQELGMYGNNEVEPLSGIMGSDIDEMSICALTCIPTPIARSILLTTDVTGHFAWTSSVSPNKFYFQSVTTGLPWYQLNNQTRTINVSVLPSPIYVFASMFSGWRGDLVFRFKFARTKFMSGRFLIGYNPKPDSKDGEVPNGSRYDFGGEIIDLRTTSTYDLVVPYQYYRDFTPVNFLANHAYNTGSVFLQVVDPLVVPPDGPQSVTFIVEVFSKCGISFANPRSMQIAVAPAATPIFAQMDKSDPRKFVSGEAVLSIKQLIARLSLRQVLSGSTGFTDDSWQYRALAVFTTVWIPSQTSFEFFAMAFKFWRGSTVLRVFGGPCSIFWNDVNGGTNQGYSFESGILNQVRRPFYGFNKVQRLRAPGASLPTSNDSRLYSILGTSTISLGIVPGDDFQFAGFFGFPPMVTTLGNFNNIQ